MLDPVKERRLFPRGIVIFVVLGLLVAAAVLFEPVSHAQLSVASQPELRIETGKHTAVIRRLSVDRAGKTLLTASNDKTARIWEIATGRMLQVLRPPIGPGSEGKLYACALSPDGKLAALGGYTAPDGEGSYIYLFDVATGAMVRRISDLPNVVNDLVFSPDGGRLAAAFAEHGAHVFETATGRLIAKDEEFEGGDSYGVDFDREGKRLVSCSDDGTVRMYATDKAGLKLIAKTTVVEGRQPHSVVFSPDGTKVAVTYSYSINVTIMSSADLRELFEPDLTGVTNGNLSAVTWSVNGDRLCAGGRYDFGGMSPVRCWSDGGNGSYNDTPAARDAVQDVQPLPDGSIIFATADPSWGIIDRTGKATIVDSAVADFRNPRNSFLVSADGGEIGFSYETGAKAPMFFSIAARRLEQNSKNDPMPPITSGLNVTNWEDRQSPMLNGQPLKVDESEVARGLAISPDRRRFVLTTSWYIRAYDKDGKLLWRTPTPATGWAANMSANGKLATAAFGDGTIRWFNMENGKELLAFFPHKDRKNWVLWTPSGYYDASPGSEDLIGWHINNGSDSAADFFPVGQFRETHYRPDIVSRILSVGDESIAIAQANADRGLKNQTADVAGILPPVVDIVTPTEGTEMAPGEITVKYRLRAPNGEPVTSVMAMVDGRTAVMEAGLALNAGKDGVERQIKVKIPAGTTLISLLATNKFAASAASVVQISVKQDRGPQTVGGPPVQNDRPKRKLYILAIGVGKYAQNSGLPQLVYPAKDAADFSAAFVKQKGRGYEDVIVKALPDATRDDVMDGLDWISKTSTDKDMAMIFLSGHGITDTGNFYYFMPSDASVDQPKRRGVPFAEIENTLVTLKGQKVLFVDTCRSGAVLGQRGIIDINGIANKLNSEAAGVAVFTASMGNESAEENSKWGNGAFTRALLDGLAGQADFDRTGEISFSMLDRYITRRVRELTLNRQTPTATKPLTVPDFLIALR